MNTAMQRKMIHIYVLLDLIKGMHILKKSERNPVYWKIEQEKSLKKFIKHIYQIPFYRSRFDASGVKPNDIKTGEDLLKLPVLTKDEYKEWILRETAGKDKYKNWMFGMTTGTSGIPLNLYSLPTDRAAEIANLFRCALMQKKKYHVIFDPVFSAMIVKPKNTKRYSIPVARQMSSLSEPKELIAGYNAAKPGFFYGNKTAILNMAQYAIENDIPLYNAKCIGSISESLDENARKVIEKAFGKGKLFDIYGCAECGNFAAEKTCGGGGAGILYGVIRM